MGYGPISPGGKQLPITNWEGSWASTVNEPIPEHIKAAHRNQHPATSDRRLFFPLTKGWKPS